MIHFDDYATAAFTPMVVFERDKREAWDRVSGTVKGIHVCLEDIAHHAAEGQAGGHPVDRRHAAFGSRRLLYFFDRRLQIIDEALRHPGLAVALGHAQVDATGPVKSVQAPALVCHDVHDPVDIEV